MPIEDEEKNAGPTYSWRKYYQDNFPKESFSGFIKKVFDLGFYENTSFRNATISTIANKYRYLILDPFNKKLVNEGKIVDDEFVLEPVKLLNPFNYARVAEGVFKTTAFALESAVTKIFPQVKPNSWNIAARIGQGFFMLIKAPATIALAVAKPIVNLDQTPTLGYAGDYISKQLKSFGSKVTSWFSKPKQAPQSEDSKPLLPKKNTEETLSEENTEKTHNASNRTSTRVSMHALNTETPASGPPKSVKSDTPSHSDSHSDSLSHSHVTLPSPPTLLNRLFSFFSRQKIETTQQPLDQPTDSKKPSKKHE